MKKKENVSGMTLEVFNEIIKNISQIYEMLAGYKLILYISCFAYKFWPEFKPKTSLLVSNRLTSELYSCNNLCCVQFEAKYF